MVKRDNRRGICSMGKLAAGGALIALLVSSATCIGPSVGDGQVACGTGGFCPPGYACGGDGRCYRDPAAAPDGAPAPDGAQAPDADVSRCGDGVIGTGETCDPISSCPTDCSDGNACTVDTLTGDAATCDAVCARSYIETCMAERDGCCPSGCSATNLDVQRFDSDCSTSCGDGAISAEETCDPPESCPTSCDDGNACTQDTLTGSAANCNAACVNAVITSCGLADGCCPAGCDSTIDRDCSATCGNGTVEAGETCDPPESCPTSCDDGDACTKDVSTGGVTTCNLSCVKTPILGCNDGDGCCPSGCTANDDGDCPSVCGNGVVEPGETCDPPDTCTCNDNNACTSDYTLGTTDSCAPTCANKAIEECGTSDNCCPTSCSTSPTDDPDCLCVCGVSDGCCVSGCPSRDPDCG